MAETSIEKLTLESLLPQSGVLVEAEQLIQKTIRGEKLSSTERQVVVGHIMRERPDISNAQMARWFDVVEGTIRYDIKKIKTEKAHLAGEDANPKLIVADLLAAQYRVLRNLARAMREMEELNQVTKPHYATLNKLYLQVHMDVSARLADMGVLPKNMGQTGQRKVIYKSVVQSKTGAVETKMITADEMANDDVLLLNAANEERPLALFDDIREGESLEQAIIRRAHEQRDAIQDVEFEDIPADAAEGSDGQESKIRISESGDAAEADNLDEEDDG